MIRISLLGQATPPESWLDRNGLVLTVGGTIIVAVFGVIGGYVARSREWKREERHESYARFSEAYRTYATAVTRMAHRHATSEWADAADHATETRNALNEAYDRVILIAGPQVLRAADAFLSTVLVLERALDDALRRGAPLQSFDFGPFNEPSATTMSRFLADAASEVGNRRGRKHRLTVLNASEVITGHPPEV